MTPPLSLHSLQAAASSDTQPPLPDEVLHVLARGRRAVTPCGEGELALAGVEGNEALQAEFNGAGYVHHGSVLDCTEAQWDFAFDLNVRSMYRTTKAFLPGMLARGNGSIVNVASGASSVKAAANRFVYAATKAAVIGLTKSVALDFITKGVRCNAICPGTIESPSLRERMQALSASTGQTLQQVEAMFVARQPMGRLGTTDEVAALAVYLASDESRFTTGTTSMVDGGWSL
jgi:2-keto-3-deoxy-L-fuconate dehydrogenase